MNTDTLERQLPYIENFVLRGKKMVFFCFDDFVCLVTPTALYIYTRVYIYIYTRSNNDIYIYMYIYIYTNERNILMVEQNVRTRIQQMSSLSPFTRTSLSWNFVGFVEHRTNRCPLLWGYEMSWLNRYLPKYGLCLFVIIPIV